MPLIAPFPSVRPRLLAWADAKRAALRATLCLLSTAAPACVDNEAPSVIDAAADAQTWPDAARSELDASTTMDSASDASLDGAVVLDPTPPVSDAGPDTSIAAPDAAAPTGTRCLGLQPHVVYEGERPCPALFCAPALSTVRVQSGELKCTENPGCKLPSDPALIGTHGEATYAQGYRFSGEEAGIGLVFNNELLRGYSLENFRRYLIGGGGEAKLEIDGKKVSVNVYESKFEFLAYENNTLHFRMTGEISLYQERVSVPPWFCNVGEVLPSLCNHVTCSYQARGFGGSAEPPLVTIEGQLTIEQPTP